jgi:FkbM family methyltransferase
VGAGASWDSPSDERGPAGCPPQLLTKLGRALSVWRESISGCKALDRATIHVIVDVGRLMLKMPPQARRHRVVRALIGMGLAPESVLPLSRGAPVHVDLREGLARVALITGSYYPQFQTLAAALLGDGGTYFDVGANVGFTTFGFLPQVPLASTHFHLFEANPTCCELLGKSSSDNPDADIRINNVCVTDQAGTSSFVFEPGNSHRGHIGSGGVDCPSLALDDYIDGQGIARVDLMKLDIEGWEPLALRGAARALSRGAIRVICTEVSSEALERVGYASAAYLAELRQHDFELFYFRAEDFAPGGTAAGLPTFALRGAAGELQVTRLRNFPDGLLTDILAIHSTALRDVVSAGWPASLSAQEPPDGPLLRRGLG